jgi:hypothetical protein
MKPEENMVEVIIIVYQIRRVHIKNRVNRVEKNYIKPFRFKIKIWKILPVYHGRSSPLWPFTGRPEENAWNALVGSR